MTDLDLLQQYEPILKFTYGELFFPTSVEPYVERCSLWERSANRPSRQLLSTEELTIDRLPEFGTAIPGQTRYMRFVQQPLDPFDFQRWRRRRGRPYFQAPGRLARVGLPARFTDSLFSLSLLLRGTVPGGTTAAASMQYEAIRRRHPEYHYYGRVVRESGYIILQYWFFYVMNDWRSTFNGANDHEADWEQVLVYLEDRGDEAPRPVWVAFAAHHYSGDDLRRRWDDPDITREGDHPVVFVGAGSHASYFEAGEYLTPVELRFVQPVLRVVYALERVWRQNLKQGDPQKLVSRIEAIVGIPFIDYARGDGFSVGPNQEEQWQPIELTPELSWLHQYRGLWGLDARDRFAGESAPGGPKFNSDGTIRQSWYDPLGWAGLSKVTPPHAMVARLEEHIECLMTEVESVDRERVALGERVARLGLEVEALGRGRQWRENQEERAQELREAEERLDELKAHRTTLTETIEACRQHRMRVLEGDFGDPQAHINHMQKPQSEYDRRQSIVAEMWAAISVGVLMIGVVALVGFRITNWVATLVLIGGILMLVESILNRRIVSLLVNVAILLAVVTSGILIYEYFWYLIVVLTLGVATLIITDNIRELRGW